MYFDNMYYGARCSVVCPVRCVLFPSWLLMRQTLNTIHVDLIHPLWLHLLQLWMHQVVGPRTTTWSTSESWISIIPPPSLLLFSRNSPRWNSLKIMYFNVQSLLPDHGGPEVQIPVQILILKTQTIGPVVNSWKIPASSWPKAPFHLQWFLVVEYPSVDGWQFSGSWTRLESFSDVPSTCSCINYLSDLGILSGPCMLQLRDISPPDKAPSMTCEIWMLSPWRVLVNTKLNLLLRIANQ